MTLLDLSHGHAKASLPGRLGSVLSRLAQARARRSLYRRTVRELNALGDRELADLGLNRNAIKFVARNAAAATRG